MTPPAFVSQANGSYRLQQPLRFDNIAQLRDQGRQLIEAAAQELLLDLSAVGAADSAGLALLMDWVASARAAGKRLRFLQVPQALLALARLSEVEPLLLGNQNG